MDDAKEIASKQIAEKIETNKKLNGKNSPIILAITRFLFALVFVVNWILGEKRWEIVTVGAITLLIEEYLKYKETKNIEDLFKTGLSLLCSVIGLVLTVEGYLNR